MSMNESIQPSARQDCAGLEGFGSREHIAQFHDDDSALSESVAAFLSQGLMAGAGCFVIATPEHRLQIRGSLQARGFDVDEAMHSGHFVALDARETLDGLLVDGRVDRRKFNASIAPLIAQAELRHPRVLAFGEMVALLSAEGKHEMALALEKLWNELAVRHAFSLLCAYPRSAFHFEERMALGHICNQHSKVIAL
jgi:hypothetical protein